MRQKHKPETPKPDSESLACQIIPEQTAEAENRLDRAIQILLAAAVREEKEAA